MPTYEVKGTKGDHHISELAHSYTKAHWIEAIYRAEGYTTEIVEVVPPNKEQHNDEQA